MWLPELMRRLRGLASTHRLDAALDEELDAHLAMLTDQFVREGLAPDAARRAARLRLGGTDQIKEAVRDERGLPWVERVGRDVRDAGRALLHNAGFTSTAVLTIGLGVGANIAIFAIVNGLLLRPLPYPNQARLVDVHQWFIDSDRAVPFTYPDFLDVRARQEVFDDIALYDRESVTLRVDGAAERTPGALVSAGVFEVLGVRPAEGRTFREGEDRTGAAPVAVLGHGLWQRRFGGEPVVGRVVALNGQAATVVGVMPPGFDFPGGAELWAPLVADTPAYPRDRYSFAAVAALKPGVTPIAARTNLDTIARQLGQEFPEQNARVGIRLRPLRDTLVPADLRHAFMILLGAVGLVLIIACANLASLLLSRAVARDQEMAVRAALGAGRGRLVCQMFVESLLLAIVGAGVGLAVGFVGLRALLAAAPATFPPWMTFGIDLTVAAFAAGLTLATAVIAGLAPALRASRTDLNRSLKDTGLRATVERGRLRDALVVGEVALALVLLVASGLMIRSVLSLLDVDPGLRADNVLTMRVSLSASAYPNPADRLACLDALVARVAAVPGVAGAAATSSLPMSGPFSSLDVSVEGVPPPPAGREPMPLRYVVVPGYFETMGVRLVAGRLLEAGDGRPGAPPVAVVNETFARHAWPSAGPVGRRLKFGDPDDEAPWVTIVGVVSDVRQFGLGQAIDDELFVPYAQLPVPSMTLVLRATSDMPSLVTPIREAVRAIDADLAVFQPLPMADVVAGSIRRPRLLSWLFGVFGSAALALAAVGVYGLLAYSVVRRTREIGVRLALGAGRREVRRMVVRRGMRLAVGGLLLGTAGSLLATRALGALLHGVDATDPVTFGAVALVLLGVARVACALPARRATRIDAMEALRCE